MTAETTNEKTNGTKPEKRTEPTKANKKSNKTWVILVIVVVVILAGLSIGGYFLSQYVSKKAGEGLVEKAIESGTGGKVDIDTKNKDITIKTDQGTISAGEGVSWPSDMPNDVPKFTVGKVTMATKVSTEPKGWSVIVSNFNSAAMTEYIARLKANGWTEVSNTNVGLNLVQMEKDNRNLNLAYDDSSKGVTLTVSYKTTQ